MKYMKYLFMAALTTVLVCCISHTAYAGDASFEIETQGFIATVVNLIFVAIAAVVSWGFHKLISFFKHKTAIDIDNSTRDYLEKALLNGLYYARAKVLEKSSNLSKVKVEQEIVAMAANYVIGTVPDALTYFDLNDEAKLKELILARLPQIEAS